MSESQSSSENEVVVPNVNVDAVENSASLSDRDEVIISDDVNSISNRSQDNGNVGNMSEANAIYHEHAYAENAEPMSYPTYEELMFNYAVTSAQVALMDIDLDTLIEDLGIANSASDSIWGEGNVVVRSIILIHL